MNAYLTVFFITFLAEMGDKTQLSTLLFSTNNEINRWGILAAASCALVGEESTVLDVPVEPVRVITAKTIKLISGIGFIGIGVWSLLTA